jgi:competence protein ComEA
VAGKHSNLSDTRGGQITSGDAEIETIGAGRTHDLVPRFCDQEPFAFYELRIALDLVCSRDVAEGSLTCPEVLLELVLTGLSNVYFHVVIIGRCVARHVTRVSGPRTSTRVKEVLVPPTFRDRLEALAGKRRDALVLIGVTAAVVLGSLALWSRGSPTVAPPATTPQAPATTEQDALAPAPAPSVPSGPLLVHVAGSVRHPGLYEIEAGARVADAIEAAGGARSRADLDALNLAEVIADGAKVEVPRQGEGATAVGAPVASASSSPAPAPVDLNSADQVALEAIPEVGPVTAAAILAYRTEIGSFSSVDQLLEVDGIGPATLEALRPYVTL